MPAVCYTADVVCPMSVEPRADAGVLVSGDRVVAVGPAAELCADADRSHHVDGVLLPGLVNAHTHLELSDAVESMEPAPAGAEQPASPTAWLRALDAAVAAWDDERWTRSARRGVQESVRWGGVIVGDVVSRGPGVPAASRAGLAGDSCVEVAGVGPAHHDEVLAQVHHALGLPAQGRRVGVAPHAASSVGTGVLRALGELAGERAAPMQLHAAHTREEAAAITYGAGPVAERARAQGLAFEWLAGTGLSPVAYLDDCGVLGPTTSLVHGVWVDEAEAALLAERDVSVVCCPRANVRFGVGDAPLERYAAARTALALGTTSTASAGGALDMLAEAAAWVMLARRRGLDSWPTAQGRRSLAEQALRLATVEGAVAMGWHGHGCLEPGGYADFVGVGIASSPATVYDDLIARGPGQQVLTVHRGVRAVRRASPQTPFPEIDRVR